MDEQVMMENMYREEIYQAQAKVVFSHKYSGWGLQKIGSFMSVQDALYAIRKLRFHYYCHMDSGTKFDVAKTGTVRKYEVFTNYKQGSCEQNKMSVREMEAFLLGASELSQYIRWFLKQPLFYQI